MSLAEPRVDELEERARLAQRRLLHTLDTLMDRRRKLRALLARVRMRLESGAVILSTLLALGIAGALFRRRRPAVQWAPRTSFGPLLLLGATAALWTLTRKRPRGSRMAGRAISDME